MIELKQNFCIENLPEIRENYPEKNMKDRRTPFFFEGWFVSTERLRDSENKPFEFQVFDERTQRVCSRIFLGRIRLRSITGDLKTFNVHSFGGGTNLYDLLKNGVVPGDRIRIEYDGIEKFRVFVQPRV